MFVPCFAIYYDIAPPFSGDRTDFNSSHSLRAGVEDGETEPEARCFESTPDAPCVVPACPSNKHTCRSLR